MTTPAETAMVGASMPTSPALEARPEPQIPDHHLLSRIGRGAYGEVWLAENIAGARRAVKIVYRDSFDEPRPYRREFEGLTNYEPISRSHEGLVAVLQIGRAADDSYFYQVMELADDAGADDSYRPRTLDQRLGRDGGALPVAEVCEIGERLAAALEFLHAKGLVHRDVKPSNIIFQSGAAKLADAGLVADRGVGLTFVGTEGYVPREGPGEPQADLFALGMVLYEAASGRSRRDFPRLPESFSSPQEMAAYRELNAVLLRACEPDVRDRFPSAEAMRAELLLLLAGLSVRELRSAQRRLKGLRRGALVGILLGAVGLLAYSWQHAEARRSGVLARVQSQAAEAARANAQLLRLNLYAADLATAQRSAEDGNGGRARALLDAYLPAAGEPDIRRFDWHWLASSLASDPHRVLAEIGSITRFCRFDGGGGLWAASMDGAVRHWASPGAEPEITDRLPDGGSLNFVAPQADGSRLFGGLSGLFRSTENGGMQALVARGSTFWAVSPDGRWAAGSSRPERGQDANEIVITDLEDPGGRGIVLAATKDWAAFSPDGALLATAGADGKFRLWRVGEFTQPDELEAPESWSACLGMAFSPDGRHLAASLGEATLIIWDAASGKVLHRVHERNPEGAWQPAFSPDGSRLAVAVGQEIWLIDVATGRISSRLVGHDDLVSCAAFAPGGDGLASVGKDGTLRLWELGSERSEAPATPPMRNRAVFSRDGAIFAGVRPGAPLEVRDSTNFAVISRLANEHEWPLAFTPDGVTLVTTNRFWEMTWWDWRNGEAQRVQRLELAAEGGGPAVALSPDGRWLAGGTATGPVVVWDTGTGKIAQRLVGHTRIVQGMAFAPDGLHLATTGDDRLPRIWDTATWQSTPLVEHGHIARDIAFSPDGRWCATACWDGWCRVFATADGALIQRFRQRTPSLDGICFTADGDLIALAEGDGSVSFRDTRSWRETIRLPGTQGKPLHHLAASPAGDLIFGNADDGSYAQAWRIRAGGK